MAVDRTRQRPQELAQGRLIRYVDQGGQIWPALVTQVMSSEIAHLRVFRTLDDFVALNVGLASAEKKQPDTWHWPI